MIDSVEGFDLIAIDKAGGRVLFLDPRTLEIRTALEDAPAKPHELLILHHLDKAYVPIFGDGVHGENPHPGHQIAVVNLTSRSLEKLIDLGPYRGPHTARLAANGMVYCCCETSGAVVVIDPVRDTVTSAIALDSRNVHRLAALPDLARIVTESEEDATLCLVDAKADGGTILVERRMPGTLNGVDAAPTRPWVVCTDGEEPRLFVVDRDDLTPVKTVQLHDHRKHGQIVRYRADGSIVAVIGDFEPVASFYDADLNHLFTAEVGDKPLDGAFTPDGRAFLVANEKSGSISVIDLVAKRTREKRGGACLRRGARVFSLHSYHANSRTMIQHVSHAAPRGIEHVGITVPDHDEALRFFESAFGAIRLFSLVKPGAAPMSAAEVGAKNGLLSGLKIVSLSMLRLANGPNIEVFQIDRPRRHDATNIGDIGITHISLTIDDLEGVTARFEAAGGTLLEGPYPLSGQEEGAGNRGRFGLTPWGLLIEFESFAEPIRYNDGARAERWLPSGLSPTETDERTSE